MTACAWVESCRNTAVHRVERRIRAGLVVVAEVCDQHLCVAGRLGYFERDGAAGRHRPAASSGTQGEARDG
jgi:hypothetical protein